MLPASSVLLLLASLVFPSPGLSLKQWSVMIHARKMMLPASSVLLLLASLVYVPKSGLEVGIIHRWIGKMVVSTHGLFTSSLVLNRVLTYTEEVKEGYYYYYFIFFFFFGGERGGGSGNKKLD